MGRRPHAGPDARPHPAGAGQAPGPVVGPGRVTFRLNDADRRARRARLYQEVRRPRLGPELARAGDALETTLAVPPGLTRMEYAFEVEWREGGSDWITDPANPLRADGPFGEKSVVELPGYRPPAWLSDPPPDLGRTRRVELAAPTLRASMPVTLWTPPGAGWEEPLPLLVVHDGPEYARHAGVLDYLAHSTARGLAPPVRAALLPPLRRDEHYSASTAYARALATELLPALAAEAPHPAGPGGRAGMGASLGALAMLHAHRGHPGTFGALFLQSGSFFRPRLDGHERAFSRYTRIVRFTGSLASGAGWAAPVPVVMTCGANEENAANNRFARDALRRHGYPVELHEGGDLHTWTGWRDALDPGLATVLRRLAR